MRKKKEENKKKDETEEKTEFFDLYNFLIRLANNKSAESSEQNQQQEQQQEQIYIIKPPKNEIIQPDTPQNIMNDVYKCKYCDKNFSHTIFLRLHLNDTKACKKCEILPEDFKDFKPEKDIRLFLENVLESVTCEPDTLKCKFCEHTFSQKGNLNKHFVINSACNRLAFYEMKMIIDKLFDNSIKVDKNV